MSDSSELSDQKRTLMYVLHKVLHLETLEDRIFDLENKNIELDVNYRILKSQLDKITNNNNKGGGQNLDDVTVTATDQSIGPFSGSTSTSTANYNYADENENRDTPFRPAQIDNILSTQDQEFMRKDDEGSYNDGINPIEFCTTSLNESEKNDFDVDVNVDVNGQSQSSNSGQFVEVISEDQSIGSFSGSTSTANYADENENRDTHRPAQIDNILSTEGQEMNEDDINPIEFCTTTLLNESEKNDFDVNVNVNGQSQSQSSNSGQFVQVISEDDSMGSFSTSTSTANYNYADENENRDTPRPAEIDNILSTQDQEMRQDDEGSYNDGINPIEFCTTLLNESEKNDFDVNVNVDVDGQSQSSNSGQFVEVISEDDSIGPFSGSTSTFTAANYADENENRDTPFRPAEIDNILSTQDQEMNEDVINPIEFCTTTLLNESEKNDFDVNVNVNGQSQSSSNSGQFVQIISEIDNILSTQDQEIMSCNDVINPIEFCSTSSLNESEKNDFDVDVDVNGQSQSQSSNFGQFIQVESEVMVDFNSVPTGLINSNHQLLMEDVKRKPKSTSEIDNSSIELKDQKTVQLDTINICLKKINRKKLATHNQSHKMRRVNVKSQNFECKICPKFFQIRGDLARHMRQEHMGSKQLHECTTCLRKFPSSLKLTTHMKTHTGAKSYSCTVCQRKFSQMSSLNRHKRIHNDNDNGEKPYGCTICPKKFRVKKHLVNHIRIHTGEKPYSCTICKRKFSQMRNLTRHKRIHNGEKPYNCTLCSKKFRAKEHLENHIRIHTGEKPYSCTVCRREFSLMRNLSRHKKVHSPQ